MTTACMKTWQTFSEREAAAGEKEKGEKKKSLKEVEVVAEGASKTGLRRINFIWPYLTDGKKKLKSRDL